MIGYLQAVGRDCRHCDGAGVLENGAGCPRCDGTGVDPWNLVAALRARVAELETGTPSEKRDPPK